MHLHKIKKKREKEGILKKMHKSLRKLINKSPDKYDDDDNEIDDLTKSFEKTVILEKNDSMLKLGHKGGV